MSSHSSASSRSSNNENVGFFQKISQNVEMAKKGYEQLVHAIIRPPRASYTVKQLGPTYFEWCGQTFLRKDVELVTPTAKTETVNNKDANDDNDAPPKVTTTKRLRMQVSVWTRVTDEKDDENDKETKGDSDQPTEKQHTTMMVYMHGNASAKTEVLPMLGFLLAQGLDGVVSFDFTGSGLSEGEYVSLGYYERFDLECVLQYLLSLHKDKDLEIILWGRSMGASTALMYASQQTANQILQDKSSIEERKQQPPQRSSSLADSSSDEEEFDDPDYPKKQSIDREGSTTAKILVKGLICDSPFASLPILCEELVEKARSQGIVVPGVIVSVALAMIGRSVKNYANFDIKEINPLEHTPTIDIPTLFIVGAEDDFIPPHHSEELIAAFPSSVRTNLFMVPGGHNDPRPPLVYEAVSQFIQNRFTNPQTTIAKQKLDVPANIQSVLHSNPPWAYSRYPSIFRALKAPSPSKTRLSVSTSGALADTANAPEEELGMTQERVDDIQNKLHAMLGQG